MSGPIVPSVLPDGEKGQVAEHRDEIGKTSLSGEQIEVIDPVLEKKLLWKVDVHVVPPLLVLFLFAFLDRVNIGNAKIQGLTTELHMTGTDYSIALFIFFIPYTLLEVPANILLRYLHAAPSTWLCSLMFFWGVMTVCEGLVQTYQQLVALRFLIGAFEAGFVPGAVYVITMYYKRYELQWRLSVFFSASILAGAFGGLFAYALSHMDGVGGYSGWRWIFIIEGLLTSVVAVIFKFLVVDWPELATFLTESERAMLKRRLELDSGGVGRMDRLDKRSAKRIFGDWKVWVGVLMYFGVVNTGYATNFFIPTIIQEMGFTSTASQIRSIPVFVAAAMVSLIVAWSTDRARHRYGFTIAGVAVGTIGYIILLCQNRVSTGIKYLACFLITTGAFMTQPVTWVWLSNNVSGHYKRSAAIALQIGLGNLGGIVASNIFIQAESPRYTTGYSISVALLLMCALACTLFYFGLKWENRRRDRGVRDYRFAEPTEELLNMGDDHPEFRFST